MSLYDEIYEAVKKIPYARVATYAQIGTMCGNPHLARVVGNALHNNPNPDEIPCYRVVNSRGGLTKSFAFGGMNIQAELLRNEGIEVNDGFVDLSKYQWRGEE